MPAGRARTGAGHADHPLAAKVLGDQVRLGGLLRVEDHLDHALAIAQIDERDPAVIPTMRHPAAQGHLAAGIARAKLPARV